MPIRRICAVLAPLAATLAAGCARPVTSELASARHTYDVALHGDAAQLSPERVRDAGRALLLAERAHAREAATQEERDLAYVAERKAQQAIAQAELIVAQHELVNAQRRLTAARERHGDAELRAAFAAVDHAARRVESAEERLRREEAARAAAEAEVGRAHQELIRLASVSSDARGTVYTVSSEVLFAFGQSALLPSARRILDEVATAIAKQPSEAAVRVEGFTDAIGSAADNLALSTARAEAVRAYLVERGVEARRLRAVGRGEDEPVANNDSPEGRANNRRVEIILERETQAMR
jgi:outer membrane protein OmpA-like peptidoglycan-associated protein